MTKYPCGWCHKPFNSFREAKAHAEHCDVLHTRIMGLGSDLASKVRAGSMKLEAAERIQAQRPKLRLD